MNLRLLLISGCVLVLGAILSTKPQSEMVSIGLAMIGVLVLVVLLWQF